MGSTAWLSQETLWSAGGNFWSISLDITGSAVLA